MDQVILKLSVSQYASLLSVFIKLLPLAVQDTNKELINEQAAVRAILAQGTRQLKEIEAIEDAF